MKKKSAIATTKKSAPIDQASLVAASLQAKILPLHKQISKIVIESEHDYELMAEKVDKLKWYDKLAAEEERNLIEPNKTAIDRIKNFFKPLHQSVKLIETASKQAMVEWREKVDKKEAKIVQMFDEGKIGHKAYLSKLKEVQTTGTSAAQVRKIKKLQITNEKLIPREYLIPDTSKITADLKAGKSIPGCKLIEETNIAI